jgi:GH24 family phage-related lysozyme (muramidase)
MPSPRLLTYLKEQENAPLLTGHISAMRHGSPEGGTDTVGYGHKLTRREHDSGRLDTVDISTLTHHDAHRILDVDVVEAANSVADQLFLAHGYAMWRLPPRLRDALIDIEFNVGTITATFPKFTRACIAGDEETMLNEYRRYYTDGKGFKKPLPRNFAFYEAFLSPLAQATYET